MSEMDLGVFPEAMASAAQRAAETGEITWLTLSGRRVAAIAPAGRVWWGTRRDAPEPEMEVPG